MTTTKVDTLEVSGPATFADVTLSAPLTLGSSITAKTSANLGYIIEVSIVNGTFGGTGVFKTLATFGSVPIGVYIAYGQLEFTPSTGTTQVTISFGNPSSTAAYGRINFLTDGTANRKSANFTTCISITTATTINFTGAATWTGTTTSYFANTSVARLIRIA